MSVRKTKHCGWMVDICYKDNSDNIKRFRKHGFTTRKEATKYEKDKITKIEDALIAELELEKIYAEQGDEANNEKKEKDEVILKDYLEHWLSTYVKVNNSPAEVSRKNYLVNIQIKPYLGNKKLKEIKPSDGEFLKAELKELDLSHRTINYALGTLKKALKSAVADQLLTHNPLQTVSGLPMVETKDKWNWLTPEESEKFLNMVYEKYPKWYVYFIVLLHTGIRIGELSGLFWEDVNLEEGFITIRRSVVRREYGPPKSKKERVIPLTTSAIEVLKEHRTKTRLSKIVRVEIAGEKHKGRHVFVDQNSNPHKYLASSIKKPLHAALTKAKIRLIRPHDLRHSFASQLRLNGISIEDIQSLLGHSDIKMTLIYSHISPNKKKIAVDVLDLRQRKKQRSQTNKVLRQISKRASNYNLRLISNN